jgi:hypothetical protein
MISYFLLFISVFLNLLSYYIGYTIKRGIANEERVIDDLSNRIKRIKVQNVIPGTYKNFMSGEIIKQT